jgi:hypothetical protein
MTTLVASLDCDDIVESTPTSASGYCTDGEAMVRVSNPAAENGEISTSADGLILHPTCDCGAPLQSRADHDDRCCRACAKQPPVFVTAEDIYQASLPRLVAWLESRGISELNGVYGDAKPRDLDGSEEWHWDAARDTVFDHAEIASEDADHVPFWVHP